LCQISATRPEACKCHAPSNTLPIFSCRPTHCISFCSCKYYHLPAAALLRAASHGALPSVGSLPPGWRSSHPRTGISGNSLKTAAQHRLPPPRRGWWGRKPQSQRPLLLFPLLWYVQKQCRTSEGGKPCVRVHSWHWLSTRKRLPSSSSCIWRGPRWEKPMSRRKQKAFLCQSPFHHLLSNCTFVSSHSTVHFQDFLKVADAA